MISKAFSSKNSSKCSECAAIPHRALWVDIQPRRSFFLTTGLFSKYLTKPSTLSATSLHRSRNAACCPCAAREPVIVSSERPSRYTVFIAHTSCSIDERPQNELGIFKWLG